MTVLMPTAGQVAQQVDLYDWAVRVTAAWRVKYSEAGHGEPDADARMKVHSALYEAAKGGCGHRHQALRVLAMAVGGLGVTDLEAWFHKLPEVEAELAAARASRTS
jgi:hypothetical protein